MQVRDTDLRLDVQAEPQPGQPATAGVATGGDQPPTAPERSMDRMRRAVYDDNGQPKVLVAYFFVLTCFVMPISWALLTGNDWGSRAPTDCNGRCGQALNTTNVGGPANPYYLNPWEALGVTRTIVIFVACGLWLSCLWLHCAGATCYTASTERRRLAILEPEFQENKALLDLIETPLPPSGRVSNAASNPSSRSISRTTSRGGSASDLRPVGAGQVAMEATEFAMYDSSDDDANAQQADTVVSTRPAKEGLDQRARSAHECMLVEPEVGAGTQSPPRALRAPPPIASTSSAEDDGSVVIERESEQGTATAGANLRHSRPRQDLALQRKQLAGEYEEVESELRCILGKMQKLGLSLPPATNPRAEGPEEERAQRQSLRGAAVSDSPS